MIAVGLNAGTSLDAIDAVRVTLRPRGDGYEVRTDAFAMIPFAPALRNRILHTFPPARADALAISQLHADVGEAFAGAALAVGAKEAHFIASHGVTLAHDGEARHTLQIGDPFRIREVTGRTVIAEFRNADTAAGGHGAPLVPLVDALLFAASHETRVALNLGGIANITILPAGAASTEATAFDTGPGNMPIDTYVAMRTDGKSRYDRAGAFAREGHSNPVLLAELLADPYFLQAPPKSTGRERFGTEFVTRHRSSLDALTFADAVATLTALSVRSISAAIRRYAPLAARLIVSGGGSHNLTLLDGLGAELPQVRVERSDAYGIDADAKEAIAFAILGYQTLRARPGSVAAATGARGARVLGAIVPDGLTGLLERVRAEEEAK